MKLKIIASIVAAGALLLPGLLLAQDSQPSLADVAKQKAGTAKAKKVITDDDMPSPSTPPMPAAASDATGGASSSATAPTGDTKPPSDATAKSETGSDSKTSVQSTKLAALQKELDDVNHDDVLLRKKLAEIQTKIDNTTDPFRKRMYEDSIETQQTTLSNFGKKRSELQQQIADEKAKPKS